MAIGVPNHSSTMETSNNELSESTYDAVPNAFQISKRSNGIDTALIIAKRTRSETDESPVRMTKQKQNSEKPTTHE